MYRFKITFIGVCVLLLQACSSIAPRVSEQVMLERWQQREQQLIVLDQWQLRGRIGLISDRDSGSGSLYWQQDADSYELKVIAPLGKGSINIKGDGNNVSFVTSKGEEQHSEYVEKLIWQRTGWHIPVKRLRYWVLGLPADETEQYQLDQHGRLQALQSGDWVVSYKRFRNAQGHELPAKVVVQGPDVKIKLAISAWQIAD